MQKEQESLKHLFQHEFSKMVAVISSLFGLQHIETAEDIVSETFLLAAETWGLKGVPENPAAWLYTVAKQKTLYQFRRNKILELKIIPQLKTVAEKEEAPEALDFSQQQIKDSQLQMIFAVCNPAIASEAQIGLALRILCGFGIEEIAEAFLSNKETINKRLFRAKEKLRTEKIGMELPPTAELTNRLDNVLHIIYLLFNEGYYSKTQNTILRKELCIEAMRLAVMLTDFDKTDLPKTNALLALMCFHASRFEARQSSDDSLILYEDQNEALWDKALIKQGMYYLDKATNGDELSSYHLEASIAYWHCMKDDSEEKWSHISELYDQLLRINYSPVVALSRVYALAKVRGRAEALAEAEQLALDNNHFYFLLLGDLYKEVDNRKAKDYLEKAYNIAKTKAEKDIIKKQIDQLSKLTPVS